MNSMQIELEPKEEQKKMWLWIILVLGFIVRIYGIQFYLPLHLHLDENVLFGQAINVLKSHSLKTGYYRYPAFLPYLQAFIYTIYLFFYKLFSSNSNIRLDKLGDILLVLGRGISVVAGTITIYITYLTGKRLFNKNIGLFAALYMALTFIHVVSSHYLVTDALMILFGTLAFYYSIELSIHIKNTWKFLLVGALIGLANATKYNPFYLIFLFGPFFSLIKQKGEKKELFFISLKAVGWGLIGAVITFCIVNPYMVIEASKAFKEVISDILLFRGKEVTIMSDANGISTWKWWLKYLTVSGLNHTMAPLPIVGLLLILINRKENFHYQLIVFPAIYCLFIFTASHRVDRYIGPVLPFFAIYAAVCIEFIRQSIVNITLLKRHLRIVLFITFLTIIFGWPLAKISAFDYLISQKDTRLLAGEWMEKNIPKENIVITIGGSIAVGHYLQSKGFDNVLNLFPFEQEKFLPFYGEIIVLSSSDYIVAYNYRNLPRYKQFYENYLFLKAEGELVKEFSMPLFRSEFFGPFSLQHSSTINDYHNPTIQIIKIPREKVKAVDFTYLPEDMPGDSMELIDDEEAPTGKAMFCSGGGVIGGPHLPFPKGDYIVDYYLKISDVTPSENIAVIYITSSGGSREYCRREIKGTDFEMRGKYQRLSLPLHLSKGSRLEFVFCSYGKVKMWIEKIVLSSLK